MSVEARQKIKDYGENTEETFSTPHCCSPEGDAFHVLFFSLKLVFLDTVFVHVGRIKME